MRLPSLYETVVVAAIAQTVSAHTTFTNFFIDGAPMGDGTCVRMSNNIQQATFPVNDITGNDMACGVNGQVAVPRICPVNAGSVFTFEFRVWPDASQPGAIDISHKGPCAVYMKKVDSATANDTAAGDGWFKIWNEDYDSSSGKWCTEKLIDNNGHLSVKIPADITGGYYLVRPELLALQQADKTPPNPQFYVGCAQIFLSSTGSSTPGHTVSIPGYVDMNNPAMTFNIYDQPIKLPYPMFGPPVYNMGSAKRALDPRTVQQAEGLKPANCVLVNDNWCGIEVASYSDQNGCWNASKDCWKQATDCYNSAGPTGSKRCPIWEAKCKGIQSGCNAGNFQGPPDAGKDLTPPMAVVLNLPPPVAPAPYASPALATHSFTRPSFGSTASPVQSSTATGSTDTCGSDKGGLACANGLCCSAHGYCGTSNDYCGSGCQPDFGKCISGSAKLRRYHKHGIGRNHQYTG